MCDLLSNLETILTIDNESKNKILLKRMIVIGGFEKLEKLQTHQNSQVYEIALRILEEFV